MERYTFERPRERLQRAGAGSLTTVELLQIVIASGNAKTSGARIARNVTALFESTSGAPSFDALLRVPGVGVAKSCQLLAAVELGVRMSRAAPHYTFTADSRVRQAAKTVILCKFSSGAGILVGEFFAPLGESPKNTIVLKHMFGDALAKGARSLEVLLGSKSQDIHTLATSMLATLRSLFDTASLLQLNSTVYLVNNHEAKRIKPGAVHG